MTFWSLWELLGENFPGGRRLPTPIDTYRRSRGMFLLWDISLVGFLPHGQTLPGAYGSPWGIFPCGILPLRPDASRDLWGLSGDFSLWDSPPGGRRFLALMGTLRVNFPCGIPSWWGDASRRLWNQRCATYTRKNTILACAQNGLIVCAIFACAQSSTVRPESSHF